MRGRLLQQRRPNHVLFTCHPRIPVLSIAILSLLSHTTSCPSPSHFGSLVLISLLRSVDWPLGIAIHGLARKCSTSMVQISCPTTVVNAAIPPLHCPIFSLGGTLVI